MVTGVVGFWRAVAYRKRSRRTVDSGKIWARSQPKEIIEVRFVNTIHTTDQRQLLTCLQFRRLKLGKSDGQTDYFPSVACIVGTVRKLRSTSPITVNVAFQPSKIGGRQTRNAVPQLDPQTSFV
jgi:hypothetical protein